MSKKKARIETVGSTGKRRRRGALLVPLVGVGVAVWVARRHLTEQHGPADGWHTLPPAPPYEPVVRSGSATPAAPVVPEEAVTQEMVVPVVADDAVVGEAVTEEMLVPAPPVAMPPVAAAPAPVPARAVPTAVAVASVTAPALPDVPGALPALDGGASPDPAYVVKGKVATRTFHVPGGPYFTRTRADVWFRTADDARAAGFIERVRRSS